MATAIGKGIYIIRSEKEPRTSKDSSNSFEFIKTKHEDDDIVTKATIWYNEAAPTIVHIALLAILILLSWGLLFFAWGYGWSMNGPWFRLAIVAIAAWTSGQAFYQLTGFPPLLAALLTGILARNLEYLDMREFTSIDMFLRKIYPVIVLGKGSLGWDTNFMRANWRRIVPLGIVPWTLEVLTLATCMHFFFGHPWVWGLMFGTFYASVSCPVIMPTVLRVGISPNRTRIWPQFVGTSGGIDTAFSVGMFGVIYSYLFADVHDAYRYAKAALTLFIGVGMGVAWGSLAGVMPHKRGSYVTELRVLFVLFGGLFASFLTTHVGWGGAAGVGVLACNAVAARSWARDGWKLNNNPASTAYRVMWATCEPVLFAYTGTFFEIKGPMRETFLFGLAILAICLTVRLVAAALAVLCPMPINTLIIQGGNELEMKYAEDILRLTVQVILVTTPIAFVLAKYMGPMLMKDKTKECENDPGS